MSSNWEEALKGSRQNINRSKQILNNCRQSFFRLQMSFYYYFK